MKTITIKKIREMLKTKKYPLVYNDLLFEHDGGFVRYNENNNEITYVNTYSYYILKYDSNDNLIYEDNCGCYKEYKYDENNNCISCRSNRGFYYVKEYDSNNKLIRYEDSNGVVKDYTK